MPGRPKRLLHLTPTCLALGLSACVSITPTRRIPSAADSLLALTYLDGAIVAHTRHVLQHDIDLRLTLGLRLDRLPAHYAATRREDARYARSVQRDLERVRYDALSQDNYLTLDRTCVPRVLASRGGIMRRQAIEAQSQRQT
jgi:hypothetical protein